MKKILSAVLLAVLLVPSTGLAKDWKYRHGYGSHRYHRHSGHHRQHGHLHHRKVVIKHNHHDDAAIAAGVLGGLVTGIILDRILFSYPSQAAYSPPPKASRDPYDAGYSDGYSRGVERGRWERYEQGKRRGYEAGYEDARSGRNF